MNLLNRLGQFLVYSNIWIAICSGFWTLGAFRMLHGERANELDPISQWVFVGVNALGVFLFYGFSRLVFFPDREKAESEMNRWYIRNRTWILISSTLVTLGLLSINIEMLWSFQFWLSALPAILYLVKVKNWSIRSIWFLKPLWVAGAWWWFTVGMLQEPDWMVKDGIWISASLFLFLLELSMLSDWVDAREDRLHGTDTWINHLSLNQVQFGVAILQGVVTFCCDSWVPVALLTVSNLAYWLIPKYMKIGWRNQFIQESLLISPLIIQFFVAL
jgi:hypothetical protein